MSFVSLDENIDTASPTGRLLLGIMGRDAEGLRSDVTALPGDTWPDRRRAPRVPEADGYVGDDIHVE